MTNFDAFTGSTAANSVEINRRLYQLSNQIDEVRRGKIFGVSSEISESGGAITVTAGHHTVAAGTGTTAIVDTINGTSTGQIIMLGAKSGHTITLEYGTGNIVTQTGADVVMSGSQRYMLIDDGTNLVVMNPVVTNLFEEIAPHTEISSTVSSVSLTSIPATYATLLLLFGLRSDDSADWDDLIVRYNSDSGSNYYCITRDEDNAGGLTTEYLTITSLQFNECVVADNGSTGYIGVGTLTIHNYASTSQYRNTEYSGYGQLNASTGNLKTINGGGMWANAAAAISTIALSLANGNIKSGFYALYGMGTAA